MLRVLFQQPWQRLVSMFRWAWDQYAYLCEIGTAVLLMLGEIVLLYDAVARPDAIARWNQWVSTFAWAIAPAYRLPAPALPPTLFWEMFIFPGGLVILPWVAIALIRNAHLEMTAWKYAPEQRLAYSIQRNRTFLSFLYVVAQFENMPRQYWRQIKAADEGNVLFSPLAQVIISRQAGPFSFAYVTLSAYLSLTPWIPEVPLPETSVVESSLVTAEPEILYQDEAMPEIIEAMPEIVKAVPEIVIEDQEAKDSDHLLPQVTGGGQIEIFLFGKVRVRLVGLDGQEWIIEKPRLAELLAYIAICGREHPLSSEKVVTYVYEQEESEKNDIQQLYYLLNNDVSELRKFFKGLFEHVGLEYKNPIITHGRGKKARRRLSESYVIADVTRLETAAKHLAEAKQHTQMDRRMVRDLYEPAIQSYTGSFLEQVRSEGYAASWALRYYEDYQVMYHQVLWDAAEYEHAQGECATSEEQQDCFMHSIRLYRDYAIVTMPGLTSERALQHSLTIAGEMGEKQLADRNYCEYVETLKRSFHRKLVDPHTTKVWEEVIGKQPGTVT